MYLLYMCYFKTKMYIHAITTVDFFNFIENKPNKNTNVPPLCCLLFTLTAVKTITTKKEYVYIPTTFYILYFWTILMNAL